MRLPKYTSGQNQGFTLLEVLVTVVILSLGLLGLAGLQLRSLQSGNDSLARTQATILAYSISDRMRVNAQAVFDGNYQVNPDNLPALPSYDCETSFPSGSTRCEPEEMAELDAAVWSEAVQTANVLPAGTGRITCVDSNATDSMPCSPNSVHLVTLLWDEARTGATGTDCSDDANQDLQCLSVEFVL